MYKVITTTRLLAVKQPKRNLKIKTKNNFAKRNIKKQKSSGGFPFYRDLGNFGALP
jgi:hypothetical protein